MTTLTPNIRVAVSTGSVAGREHLRLHRCNQDAVAWRAAPDLVVCAVADGCSAGRHSEVGAQLAVGWIARHGPAFAGSGAIKAGTASAICAGLVAFLKEIACGLTADQVPSAEVIQDYFLFTLLVALVDPRDLLVFGVGDGMISVNGGLRSLPAGPGNQPHYLGYALLGDESIAPAACPAIHWQLGTPALDSLILATDGASALPSGELAELETAPRFVRNPSLVQKRLNVLGAADGRLWDDTTVLLVRRRGGLT